MLSKPHATEGQLFFSLYICVYCHLSAQTSYHGTKCIVHKRSSKAKEKYCWGVGLIAFSYSYPNA